VPTTLDEYIANGEKLAAANPGKSGIWWPGQDWYNALPTCGRTAARSRSRR
jgi:N,N'-diacetylchitobiose transport system substrate-binding protein